MQIRPYIIPQRLFGHPEDPEYNLKSHSNVDVPGMEDTSCDRKEVLQDLVGSIKDLWVTEGPFGRIRAANKDAVCESVYESDENMREQMIPLVSHWFYLLSPF